MHAIPTLRAIARKFLQQNGILNISAKIKFTVTCIFYKRKLKLSEICIRNCNNILIFVQLKFNLAYDFVNLCAKALEYVPHLFAFVVRIINNRSFGGQH